MQRRPAPPAPEPAFNEQPTPMERHQAFLNHIAARGQGAAEAKQRGKLEGSGYSEDDIQRYREVFGVEPEVTPPAPRKKSPGMLPLPAAPRG